VNAIDETLPNSKKREHPRKGEKKKQGARTKVQAGKPPKRGNWIIQLQHIEHWTQVHSLLTCVDKVESRNFESFFCFGDADDLNNFTLWKTTNFHISCTKKNLKTVIGWAASNALPYRQK
jgi:hypothetical protein